MKTPKLILNLAALLGVVFTAELSAQPTASTYQGHLSDNGSAANGIYDLEFTLYNSSGGPTVEGGPLTHNAIAVNNGLFTVQLDFGSAAFDGGDRWLEIGVRTNGSGVFSTLLPRQQITSTPYAIKAANAMTVDMGIITDPAFIGTTTMTPLELSVNNQRALRLEDNGDGSSDGDSVPDGAPNVIGGSEVNSVAAGVVGATISGGGATNYAGIARPNTIASDYATISGGVQNSIQSNAFSATLGGGWRNTIQSDAAQSTVGGGFLNTIQTDADYTIIGGGRENTIQPNADYATVGGGLLNAVQTDASRATIGGGEANSIETNATFATIGGGRANTIQANADHTSIGGGVQNRIQSGALEATIGGGSDNTIQTSAVRATIGGGWLHTIESNAEGATVGGGVENAIWTNAAFATVGGGQRNTATATNATVAGGHNCWAGGIESFVGGGSFNQASGDRATIGGGNVNSAGGTDSTVPGGRLCSAAANVSFAAGNQAKAYHTGAFVWADSQTNNFISTTNNQFLIRASGGVGIGLTQPRHPLHVGTTLGSNSINVASQRTVVEHAADNGRAAFLALAGAGGVVSDRVELQMEASEQSSLGIVGTASAHPLEIRTDNQARLTIASGGDLSVSPPNTLAFGAATRQMLNLWSTIYGIGVQADALYCRTDTGFAWFRDGVHSDIQNDPGTGGTLLMRLDGVGNLFTTGAVNPPSDRNLKQDFAELDPVEVLQKVLALPVQTWAYTNNNAVRHLGPVAQDFHAAFGLGADDRHIATVDADGVALAAIQGLNEKVEVRSQRSEARSRKLEERLQQKDAKIAMMEQRLAVLEQLMNSLTHQTH